MAELIETKKPVAGFYPVTVNTLTLEDSFKYVKGSGQSFVILDSSGGEHSTLNLIGNSGKTSLFIKGYGEYDLSRGFRVDTTESISVLPDNFHAFLTGNSTLVRNGTGVKVAIFSN